MKAIKADSVSFEQNNLLQLTCNQFEKMLKMVPELCKKMSESSKPPKLGKKRDPTLSERDAIYWEKLKNNMLEEYWWKLHLKQARKEEVIKAGIRKDKIIEILDKIFLKQFHLNDELNKKYQKDLLLNKLLIQLDIEKKKSSLEQLEKKKFNSLLLKKVNENDLLKEFFLQLQNKKKIFTFFNDNQNKEKLAINNKKNNINNNNTNKIELLTPVLLNGNQNNLKKWNQKVAQLERFTKEIINQELINTLYNRREKLVKQEKPIISVVSKNNGYRNNRNLPKSENKPLELKRSLEKIWKHLELDKIVSEKQYVRKIILHKRIQALFDKQIDLKSAIKNILLRKINRIRPKTKDTWIKDKFQYQQKIVQLIEREIEEYFNQKIKQHTKQIASDFKKKEKLIHYKLIHKHFLQFFHEILLDKDLQKKLDRMKKRELMNEIKLDYKALEKGIFNILWKETIFLKLLLKSRLEEISHDLDKTNDLINNYQEFTDKPKQYKEQKQRQIELRDKIFDHQEQTQESLSYVGLMFAQAKEAIRIRSQKVLDLQLPKIV